MTEGVQIGCESCDRTRVVPYDAHEYSEVRRGTPLYLTCNDCSERTYWSTRYA